MATHPAPNLGRLHPRANKLPMAARSLSQEAVWRPPVAASKTSQSCGCEWDLNRVVLVPKRPEPLDSDVSAETHIVPIERLLSSFALQGRCA